MKKIPKEASSFPEFTILQIQSKPLELTGTKTELTSNKWLNDTHGQELPQVEAALALNKDIRFDTYLGRRAYLDMNMNVTVVVKKSLLRTFHRVFFSRNIISFARILSLF